MSCEHSKSKRKHSEISPESIVFAVPPDVAMNAHAVHDIQPGHWTVVFTSCGLSQQTKDSEEPVSNLLQALSIDVHDHHSVRNQTSP